MRASVDVGCDLRWATHGTATRMRARRGHVVLRVHNVYTEHGPDWQFDGRCLDRYASVTTVYILDVRGESKDSALVADDANHTKSNGRFQNPHSICAHSFVNV